MKESGKKAKQMDLECIVGNLVTDMRDSLKTS